MSLLFEFANLLGPKPRVGCEEGTKCTGCNHYNKVLVRVCSEEWKFRWKVVVVLEDFDGFGEIPVNYRKWSNIDLLSKKR